MIRADDFTPVTLEDRGLFADFYRAFPQLHSDNSFANMVSWGHYAHYRKALHGEHLLLSSTVDGETRYRFPVGPRDDAVLGEVLRLALAAGGDTPVVVFNGQDRKTFHEAYPGIPLHPHRPFFEYVYRSSDLADLPGKPYLTIRHQLNRFRRRCSYESEPLGRDNREEVAGFLERWCDWRDCGADPVLANEREAILFALSRQEALGLSGLVIQVDGQVAALSVYQELNPETAVVHFEKGLPDCEGIYQAVNHEAALLLRGRYPFINRESDLGMPGLREAKTRYHPHHMVEVYYTRRSEMEGAL